MAPRSYDAAGCPGRMGACARSGWRRSSSSSTPRPVSWSVSRPMCCAATGDSARRHGGPATRATSRRAAPAHAGDAHRPLRRPPRRRRAAPRSPADGHRGRASRRAWRWPLSASRPWPRADPRVTRNAAVRADRPGVRRHGSGRRDPRHARPRRRRRRRGGGAGRRRPAPLAAAAGRLAANSPYASGERHRLRQLAPAGVGPVADHRAGRAVRLGRGVPAGRRGPDRHGRGPRPRDALPRRPAGGRLPDGRDPGRGRVHRGRRRAAGRRPVPAPWSRPRRPQSRDPTRSAPTCCARRTGGRRATACPARWCTRAAGQLVPAADAVAALVDHVAAALDAVGDRALVDECLDRIWPWSAAAPAASGRPSSAPARSPAWSPTWWPGPRSRPADAGPRSPPTSSPAPSPPSRRPRRSPRLGPAGAPTTHLDLAPMADGGPGFVDVLHAALGGELLAVTVRGPFGDPVPATLLRVGDRAYVESAQACGLHLTRGERAEEATTVGVGELVAAAVDAGAREVVVGLGGSGTNDGGAGAARRARCDRRRPARRRGVAGLAGLGAGRPRPCPRATRWRGPGGRHRRRQPADRAVRRHQDLRPAEGPRRGAAAGRGRAPGGVRGRHRPAYRRWRRVPAPPAASASRCWCSAAARRPGIDLVAEAVDLPGRARAADLVRHRRGGLRLLLARRQGARTAWRRSPPRRCGRAWPWPGRCSSGPARCARWASSRRTRWSTSWGRSAPSRRPRHWRTSPSGSRERGRATDLVGRRRRRCPGITRGVRPLEPTYAHRADTHGSTHDDRAGPDRAPHRLRST